MHWNDMLEIVSTKCREGGPHRNLGPTGMLLDKYNRDGHYHNKKNEKEYACQIVALRQH